MPLRHVARGVARAGMQVTMKNPDQWIARANIEHFRRRLAEATDEAERRTIMRLLVEEEEKLRLALAGRKADSKKA